MTELIEKRTKCGLCGTAIPGGVRNLNRHKSEAHPDERAAMRAKRKARVAGRGVSMNYCTSCAKFVGLEAGEPEEQGIDVNDEGIITGSVRLIITCADCGQEMADSTVEVEEEIEFPHATDDCESDLEVDNCTVEGSEEGGGRFSKHLYFADVTVSLSCNTCKATTEYTSTTERVAASSFDSCQ